MQSIRGIVTSPDKRPADRIAIISLVLAQLLFGFVLLTYGRFIAHDEIGSKATGRGWAATGKYFGPEEEGVSYWPAEWRCRPPLPPLYGVAFGSFIRLFGFSFRTNVAFDVVIQIMLSWICFAMARTLDPGGPKWPAAVAAILLLPLGNPGRPDALGMILGFGGWLITRRSASVRSWCAAGVFIGLSAAASLAGGFFIGVLLLLRRNRPLSVIAWAGTAAVVFSSVMMVVHERSLVDSLAGILNLASAATERSWSLVAEGFRHGYSTGPALIAMLIPIVLAGRSHRSLWLAPLAVQLAIPLIFPREFYYIWLMGPMMLAIALILFHHSNRRLLIALLAVPVYLYAISRVVLLTAVLATLPPAQQVEPNIRLIETIIPRSSTVMTWDYWPMLSDKYRVFVTEANPDWKYVDYIVLTGNGSGRPGQRQMLFSNHEEQIQSQYEVILDRLNRQPFALGPIRTNSAYGFGPIILKRIRQEGESNESAHIRTACW